MAQPKHCSSCGAINSASSRMCHYCGFLLSAGVSSDTILRRRIEDLIRKDPVVLKKVAICLELV